MMRVAIMQPYFFPYLGYWQLIHSVDHFVLLDDVQYIHHGWINRNRILKPGGGWQYIVVPVNKHPQKETIRNIQAHSTVEWKQRILGQLAHYRKRAPRFEETVAVVADIFGKIDVQGIAEINSVVIKRMCEILDLRRNVFLSSRRNFDYSDVGDAGEWALRICEQMGATEYINSESGAGLFDKNKFASSNIRLSFMRSLPVVYDQGGSFEPALSILDVMMFNGIDGTKRWLSHYTIESV